MNLQSCCGCGVVIDTSKLIFADNKNYRMEDGSINEDLATYCHDGFVRPFVPCPVCSKPVFENYDPW